MKKEKTKYPRCQNCGRELKPDLTSINFKTKKWDEHGFTCECFPRERRIVIL